jgi:hypothetical protein
MRTKLLAVTCGILFLLSIDHAFADHVSSPFLRLSEADGTAAGNSPPDAPIEPGTDPRALKAQPKSARSPDEVALSERLKDLITSQLQHYVTRPQDRTAVEAFYRERDFVPIRVNAVAPMVAVARRAVRIFLIAITSTRMHSAF